MVLALGMVPTVNMAQAFEYNTYGPTTESDHLWSIANEMRPSKWVTPQQMMIAIQQLNPRAFMYGNINGLKKGFRLRMPTLRMVRLIDALDSELKVQYQNKHWNPSGFAQSSDTKPTLVASTKTVTPTTIAKTTETTVATTTTPTPTQLQRDLPRPIAETSAIVMARVNPRFKNIDKQIKNIRGELAKQMQQTKLRVDVLEDENVVIKKQVMVVSNTLHKLSDRLNVEEQEFTNMIADLRAHQSDISAFFAEYGGFMMIAGGLIVLMFLVYGVFFSRQRHTKKTLGQDRRTKRTSKKACFVGQSGKPLFENDSPTKQPNIQTPIQPQAQADIEYDDEEEDEYDFLNSEEGTAAKLDLARAYIDMGDFVTARQVLREVRENGKPDLQQKAQKILEKIQTSTTE